MKQLLNISLLMILALFSVTSSSWAEDSNPSPKVQLEAQLFTHGQTKYLAITFDHSQGWHTYWQNPGDSGTPSQIEVFINNAPVSVPVLWPTPIRFIEKGDIWGYGYKGLITAFIPLDDSLLKKVNEEQIKIHARWLSCNNICVPEEQTIEGNIEDKKTLDATQLEEQFKNIPQKREMPANLELILARSTDKNNLLLIYKISGEPNVKIPTNTNLLTPFLQEPFTYKHEKLFSDSKGTIYGQMEIDWDGKYMEPEMLLPIDGIFVQPYTLKFLLFNLQTQQMEEIQKEFKSFNLDTERLINIFSILSPIKFSRSYDEDNTNITEQGDMDYHDMPMKTASTSIFIYIFLALLGGLILNIMPCVLPVISIKLFGLIKHRNESHGKIFLHNFFYSLGILFTFAVLATVVIALKASGEEVGWGLQLQSPTFIILMIILLFIFTLNLFSMFEFVIPGGRFFGNIHLKNNYTGDFVNGILATILATPCSAPFLGTALAFAFSSSYLTIMLIFLSIGIGLSTPFIITGIFPRTIAFLPRPGQWMDHCKKFLGLTLIFTIIWLMDVLQEQSGYSAITKLMIILSLIFFAIYIHYNISKRKIITAASILIPLIILINLLLSPAVPTSIPKDDSIIGHVGLNWEKWSQGKMDEYQKTQTLTFIDFTSKWCITCKANEKLVLDTDAFRALVKEKNVSLLLADWTQRNPLIGKWLQSHGYAGVPAYFIINSNGKLIALGETISISKIRANLN